MSTYSDETSVYGYDSAGYGPRDYEPSEDLIFIILNAQQVTIDIFTFYGPPSAGNELADKRAALYDGTWQVTKPLQ